jgi:hypothetical protein
MARGASLGCQIGRKSMTFQTEKFDMASPAGPPPLSGQTLTGSLLAALAPSHVLRVGKVGPSRNLRNKSARAMKRSS